MRTQVLALLAALSFAAASTQIASATSLLTGSLTVTGANDVSFSTTQFAINGGSGTVGVAGGTGNVYTIAELGYTIATMTSFTSTSTGDIFAITDADNLKFYLTGITYWNLSITPGSYPEPGTLTVDGNGYFTDSVGDTSVQGTFVLNASSSNCAPSGNMCSSAVGTSSFTFTPSVSPEPSSLVLLGTGLMGLAALARRRILA